MKSSAHMMHEQSFPEGSVEIWHIRALFLRFLVASGLSFVYSDRSESKVILEFLTDGIVIRHFVHKKGCCRSIFYDLSSVVSWSLQ